MPCFVMLLVGILVEPLTKGMKVMRVFSLGVFLLSFQF